MTTSISGQSAFYPPRPVLSAQRKKHAGIAVSESRPRFGTGAFGKPGRMQRFAKWPERQAYRLLDYWEKSLNRVKKWVSGGMMVTIASLSCLPMPKWFMNVLARRYFFSPRSVSSSLLLKSDDLFKDIKEVPFRLPSDKSVRLEAWHLKAQENKPTILFSHGRDCNISHMEKVFESFRKKGYGVYAYDYPGFGRSEGKASEKALYESARAAAEELRHLTDIKGKPVGFERQIIMGHSLGGAVAVNLAKQLEKEGHKPEALVVINTFSNIKDALGNMYNKLGPWGRKMISTENLHKRIDMKFDSISKIQTLKMPVLALHADKDKFVDYKLGEKLYAAAQKSSDYSKFVTLKGEPHSLNQSICDTAASKLKDFLENMPEHAKQAGRAALQHRL